MTSSHLKIDDQTNIISYRESMAIKQRAIATEEKRERHLAIICAAQKLMSADLSKIPSVDELAKKAGLAKGTVYLYFPSKEELLLAVHAENSRAFFIDMVTTMSRETTVTVEDMRPVVRKHMVENHAFLALASRCMALMDKDIPVETVVEHKTAIGNALHLVAAQMIRHFPPLNHDEALRLLQHTYATILGLWQMLHPVERLAAAMQTPQLACFSREFEIELTEAIYSLWHGRIERLRSQLTLQSKPVHSPPSLTTPTDF
jgi:AcrR family transcriptional regulator